MLPTSLTSANTFAALADDSVGYVGGELSQGPLADQAHEADDREEMCWDAPGSDETCPPLACSSAVLLLCAACVTNFFGGGCWTISKHNLLRPVAK